MVKRKTKISVRNPPLTSQNNETRENIAEKENVDEKHTGFINDEVERRINAIQAIRDVEAQHWLTQLRLLRSCFSTEQLESSAFQFFKENLPNLSVIKNEKHGVLELEKRVENSGLPFNYEADVPSSILQRTCIASMNPNGVIPDTNGFDFSARSAKTSFMRSLDLQAPYFSTELAETTMLFKDAFKTPGGSNQRLSIGMTPKTLRLPKPGEMLLSVHGSPLGLYGEEKMEAIHESEED